MHVFLFSAVAYCIFHCVCFYCIWRCFIVCTCLLRSFYCIILSALARLTCIYTFSAHAWIFSATAHSLHVYVCILHFYMSTALACVLCNCTFLSVLAFLLAFTCVSLVCLCFPHVHVCLHVSGFFICMCCLYLHVFSERKFCSLIKSDTYSLLTRPEIQCWPKVVNGGINSCACACSCVYHLFSTNPCWHTLYTYIHRLVVMYAR